MTPILNFGSLNIDHVYRMPHIVLPGETLTSRSYQLFAGGKGANQSVALARAGASVAHAGKVGRDGRWLVEKLAAAGVETRWIEVVDDPTGHALIQVDDAGQNAIVLHAGTNRQITRERMAHVLAQTSPGTILLLQNEINDVAHLLEAGHARGLKVCLNPAPFGEETRHFPFQSVDILIVNEAEGEGLSGERQPEPIISRLSERLPAGAEVILTLGSQGALYGRDRERMHVPAKRVQAVDTTAAGDTFIGYYLAARTAGQSGRESLELACAAAAVCVARPGAMDSIPTRVEVQL